MEKPTTQTAAPEMPATAPVVAPAPEKIVPKKRSFHWWTPIVWGKDFFKGTFDGMANGLAKGAQKGLKFGLLAATVAFFLPLFPAAAAGLASVAPWLTIGANAAGVATFIPTGLNALVAGLGWGLAGAAVGAVFTGAMGLVTGGAFELKMRGRREKYAEELAERAEMRARTRVVTPSINSREYARGLKQQQYKYNEDYFNFNAENIAEQNARNAGNSGSWVDYVMGRGSNGERYR